MLKVSKPIEMLSVDAVPRKQFYLFVKKNQKKLVPQSSTKRVYELMQKMSRIGVPLDAVKDKTPLIIKAIISTFSTKIEQAFVFNPVYKALKKVYRLKMIEDVCFGWVGASDDFYERLEDYAQLSSKQRRRTILKRFIKASEVLEESLKNEEPAEIPELVQHTHELEKLDEADNIRVADSNIVPVPAIFTGDKKVDSKIKSVLKEGPTQVKVFRETKEERAEATKKRVAESDAGDTKVDRYSWCRERMQKLATEYSLETADQMQLQSLVALEWCIREYNARITSASVDPKKLNEMIDTHNTLMKALNITRKARQDRGDEAAGILSWEKLVRFHDNNKKIRYEQASEQLEKDWAKLRAADETAKVELEKIGFFGEWGAVGDAESGAKMTILNPTLGEESEE